MKNLVLILAIGLAFKVSAQQKDSVKVDTIKTQNLMEVVVKSGAPLIQVLTDKVLLNVDAMPNAAGTNALELLRLAPGVTVDGQDNIQMSGKKGVQVLLDGRLQNLSAQQIASLLKAIDAANIKTIEVIANPSSKYDAAGNAGIINIVYKKSNQYGTNGSVTLGYQQMQNYRQNSAFNLNWKAKNVNVFTNGNYDNSLQFTTVKSDRYLADKTFLQSGVEQQGYKKPGVRAGVDYQLNSKNTIGAIVNFNQIWDDFPSYATTLIQNGNQNQILNTITTANLTENRLGTNLNYQFKDTTGKTLNVEADWLNYKARLTNFVSNTFNDNNGINSFDNDTKTGINLFSAKADLSTKFLKDGKFEGGLKFISSQTENNLKTMQEDVMLQQNQTNDFNYREQVYAAYGSFNKNFDKWSLNAGLRTELTQSKGQSLDNEQSRTILSDSLYLNFFPTVFLRFQKDENHSFGFSYTKRLNRPSFQDQNPYIYRTDFYYAQQGNPLLLPQYTQSFGLDFTWKGQTQIKLNFNQTKNLQENIIIQTGDQTLAKWVNAGTRSFLNINVSSPFQIAKFWSGYASAEPYYQFYKADLSKISSLGNINNGGLGFNSYISNNFDLGKKWTASLSNWFNYASRSSIYKTKAITSVDAAFKKQLPGDKMTLNLAYRDIFNTQRWVQTALAGDINQSSVRKWESSGAYIGLSYRFGNQKIKVNKKEVQTDERIKSRN
jgi:iron complex outermembrane receptor protein